ncbi:flavodoxin [Clostridium rectalis]|uniref:flavodoxin n=1 Tax=Clostridium rectalis TaxID=2040295 RepID=UPI000F6434D6|nr:flavodoxin [Clostridium rectalis]
MKKLLISYWSGTGNTEIMANCISEGAKNEEVDILLKRVDETSIEDIKEADAIALGCPSMGDEVLEESEMEPFVESLQNIIGKKHCVLFGSYGWGDGKWMRDWYERMESYNADLITEEGLIVNNTPDADGEEQCKQLGKTLSDKLAG